jgi:thiopeptide-type bacteriocin biosynthesis protein
LKLYGGPIGLETLLMSEVRPLITQLKSASSISKWFFIRYADPQFHLRIRIQTSTLNHAAAVRRQIDSLIVRAIRSGKIWRAQFDTYEREVERYGGLKGVLASEDIFWADSDAVLDMLSGFTGDDGFDARWRAGLVSIDALLNDFGLQPFAKLEVLRDLRDAYRLRFKAGPDARQRIAQRFRVERERLRPLFFPSGLDESDLSFIQPVLKTRSARIKPIVEHLKSLQDRSELQGTQLELLGSYTHIHVNRLFQSAGTIHELVLYDLLYRFCDENIARCTNS